MLYQEIARDETQTIDGPGRTRIETLSEVGFELTEAELELAVGGMPPASSGTCTEPGACDDD